MQANTPPSIHSKPHPHDYTFLHHTPESTPSVSEEGHEGVGEEEEWDEEEEDRALEEDTRLRYQRLQARGRAAELAFHHRLQREKEEAEAKSRSHSRSRPQTTLGALFKRDNSVLSVPRSQSSPVSSSNYKTSRRQSISSLFKLNPLSRSSSSKSIYNPTNTAASSTSSSQATSPFSSPRTPISPLPFLFSPKTRRKPVSSAGEDVEIGFGSPLTRVARRPSPVRSTTLPESNTLGL